MSLLAVDTDGWHCAGCGAAKPTGPRAGVRCSWCGTSAVATVGALAPELLDLITAGAIPQRSHP